MKIFIITQDEPFYLPLSIEKVVRSLATEIVGVAILPRYTRKSSFQVMSGLFELYGLRSFVIQVFDFMKAKLLNKISYIFPIRKYYSVAKIFKDNKIPIHYPANVNDQQFVNKLKDLEIDIVISIACPVILKIPLLSQAKHGNINVHGSMLPRYRGKNIAFWLLLNQETKTGVTVHYIDDKIDSGKIINQQEVSISSNETVDSLYKKTVPLGGDLLIKAVNLIKQNQVEPKANDPIDGTNFSDPGKEEIKKFRSLGKSFR
ncbi:MAG: hypothetical protein CMI53_03305 [Parcubacteria group bacterium]|nr:hypothetical protein [Parcubacteria group bacterium]|tara:strand:- start:8232 stop:9011 length:780 start_codon:yes stop_codon:yes gene_type:complete